MELELTDYVILSSETEDLLRDQILRKAKSGYKLQGGVQVVIFPGARYAQFFQAMKKEEAYSDDTF